MVYILGNLVFVIVIGFHSIVAAVMIVSIVHIVVVIVAFHVVVVIFVVIVTFHAVVILSIVVVALVVIADAVNIIVYVFHCKKLNASKQILHRKTKTGYQYNKNELFFEVLFSCTS